MSSDLHSINEVQAADLITAIMPLKNYHLPFLKKSVASMINQTSPDWRLLIVVEKADRNRFCEILCDELNDSRLEIVVNEGRRMAGAYNTGMKSAKTDFVGALLSDDVWSTDAVEVLISHIKRHRDIDFFHSSRRVIDENDQPISSVFNSTKIIFSLKSFISAPVKHLLCWRKDLALSFGGMDEAFYWAGTDDYDFPWCMAEHGARFMAIKECLYLYRSHFEAFRLTTHTLLEEHTDELRKILAKHGVAPETIEARVEHAKNSYLKQCMFNSPLERWMMEHLKIGRKRHVREEYK